MTENSKVIKYLIPWFNICEYILCSFVDLMGLGKLPGNSQNICLL